MFDRVLFLPPRAPRVAAWHVQLLEGEERFFLYQKELVRWLKQRGFALREKDFLAHVTIARAPIAKQKWQEAFRSAPLFVKDIQLCKSLGFSKYEVLWKYPILAPFDEIEHTADIAFRIRGKTLAELRLHAQLALGFHCPSLLSYFEKRQVADLQEIVQSLNRTIARCDAEQGCPFKAVSFHGRIEEGTFLEWEMIVDV
jgi:hypothetical protein